MTEIHNYTITQLPTGEYEARHTAYPTLKAIHVDAYQAYRDLMRIIALLRED